MKVSGTGRVDAPKKTSKTAKTDKSQSGKFAAHLQAYMGEVGEVHSADAPQSLAGVESVIAVQAADDSTGEEARRRMARRGEEILDRLDEIRNGLLQGWIPKERLMEIAHTVRQRREKGSDPQLSAILDEIELRAEVELAKLSRRD